MIKYNINVYQCYVTSYVPFWLNWTRRFEMISILFHILRSAYTAGLIFVTSAGVLTQSRSALELDKRIDELAGRALSRPTAGLSIAVAMDGKLVFAKGYGMANLDHSVKVTPDTVFHIASISKNILSAVLLQLAEQGKLSLDDHVAKYIPEAPLHGRHVTVRQLLNHTSGIYSFTSLPEAETNEFLDLSNDQVLTLIKDRSPDFEPGTSWRYNNSAFYMAGMVVERVTTQDYATYVREHVFRPLGMSTASLCDAHMVVPNLTSGYERAGGKLVPAAFLSWKLPFAAGAVCATPTDLVKWQTALESGRFINDASATVMRSQTTLTDGTSVDYGLGTRIGSLDGHRAFGHTGSGGGFGNVLVNYPDRRLTIIVLTNTGSSAGSALSIAAAIARTVFGTPEANVPDLSVPAAELSALSGTYDSDEGTVENFGADGKLHFRVPADKAEGVLLRQAENLYAVNKDTIVRFVVRDGHAAWAMVYTGRLFMNAARRMP